MSIVLQPEMTPLVAMISQNVCCGRGTWCNSLSLEVFLLSGYQLAHRYKTPKKLAKGHSFCPLLLFMSEAFSISFIL